MAKRKENNVLFHIFSYLVEMAFFNELKIHISK